MRPRLTRLPSTDSDELHRRGLDVIAEARRAASRA